MQENDIIAKAAKAEVNILPKYPVKEVHLKRSGSLDPKTNKPAGVVVSVPSNWHVSDTQAAQRISKGDSSAMTMALAQRVCLFDGKKWPIEDIEELISGKDWLLLQGELLGDDEEDEKND